MGDTLTLGRAKLCALLPNLRQLQVKDCTWMTSEAEDDTLSLASRCKTIDDISIDNVRTRTLEGLIPRLLFLAPILLIAGAMAAPAENCEQAAAAGNDDFHLGESAL